MPNRSRISAQLEPVQNTSSHSDGAPIRRIRSSHRVWQVAAQIGAQNPGSVEDPASATHSVAHSVEDAAPGGCAGSTPSSRSAAPRVARPPVYVRARPVVVDNVSALAERDRLAGRRGTNRAQQRDRDDERRVHEHRRAERP
jgi:hypothetical protein